MRRVRRTGVSVAGIIEVGQEGAIETTQFLTLYYDSTIGQYIHSCAWGRARGDEDMAELYTQDAWIRVSRAPDDMTMEYYCECARKAVHAAYCRERRQRGKEYKLLQKLLQKRERSAHIA